MVNIGAINILLLWDIFISYLRNMKMEVGIDQEVISWLLTMKEDSGER